MSNALRCRECGSPLRVANGRGKRAHDDRDGRATLRRKRCQRCGHEETTVEIAMADFPLYVAAYNLVNREN